MDPFARQARQYLLQRPRYPGEFLASIREHCPAPRGLCLDFACGSGQLTVDLARCCGFAQVHAVDRSQAQLDNASVDDNRAITYTCADNLASFPSHTYDCVTVAQAFHWMDPKPTLQELHRVLKPAAGVLAVMGYGVCSIQHNRAAQQAFSEYYASLSGRWECDRTRLDSAHAGDVFSPPFSRVEQRLHVKHAKQVPVDDFVKYLQTWSVYQEEKDRDSLRPFVEALGQQHVYVEFPFWMILAKR